MRAQYFATLSLLTFMASHVCHGMRSGYALNFQGDNPVAAIKKGYVDFTDPGMQDIEKNITVALWAYTTDSNPSDLRMLFSWANRNDGNHFQPFVQWTGLLFGNEYAFDDKSVDLRGWHHYAASLSDGVVSMFFDGEVMWTTPPGDYNLRGPETSINLGANTYTRIKEQAKALPSKSLYGQVDEFTIFSRGLNQTEVRELMKQPLDVTQPLDPTIVLHYNFDVSCTGSPQTLLSSNCLITGDDLIPNYGSAGSEYDLLMGMMNDDYGFGKTWIQPSSGSGCPVEYPFLAPTLIKSTVPFQAPEGTPEFLTVPIVEFVEQNGTVAISLPEGHGAATFRLDVPTSQGTLTRTSDNTVLALSDTVAGGSGGELEFSASEPLAGPVWAKFTEVGSGEEVFVHIWEYQAPELNANLADQTLEVLTLEDNAVTIRLRPSALLQPSGDYAYPVITSLPSKGTLYQVSADIEEINLAPISTQGEMVTHPAGAVRYVPGTDKYGEPLESFQVIFRSNVTGLESQTLTVSLTVLPVDDQPLATPTSISVDEDQAEGVEITLDGYDSESIFGIVINSLPSKGKLYTLTKDGKKDRLIDKPFEIYDVGSVKELFVSDVLNVSSFWGGPPYSGYHALNVIGRQTCWERDNGECQDNRNAEWVVGDYVRVDRYFADDEEDELYLLGIVKAVYEPAEEGGEKTFDILLHPMQRVKDKTVPQDEWVYVPCIMQGGSYPSQCSVEEAENNPDGLLLQQVPQSKTKTIPAGVWSPLRQAYIPAGSTMVGGESAAAYGSQYNYVWNQDSGYVQGNDKFTEFIEVKYDEFVFPVAVEVGSPRGTGAIVKILALDSDGVWRTIYKNPPDFAANQEQVSQKTYHQFSPGICQPFFATNALRLELDTSGETGIGDWNYIDYIKLLGSPQRQPSMIQFPVNKVLYVPDQDQFGEDSFHFSTYDCGGQRLRRSDIATVQVSINPLSDAPTGKLLDLAGNDLQNKLAVDAINKVTSFNIEATEVDQQAVTISISKLPGFGMLLLNSTAVTKGEKMAPTSSDAKLTFGYSHPGCNTFDGLRAQTTFSYVIEDSDGNQAESTVKVEVDCSKLARRYTFAEESDGAVTLSAVYGAIGLVVSMICLGFNIKYRKVQVVRLTSPKINVIIVFGTSLVSIYLLSFYRRISAVETCKWDLDRIRLESADVPDYTCSEEGNTCCSDAAASMCVSRLWLLSLGVIFTFGSLFSKTLRVIRIFQSSFKKVKGMKDRQLLRTVALQVAALMVLLILWAIISPSHVEFRLGKERIAQVQGQEILEIELVPSCASDHHTTFIGLLVIFVGGLLAYGAYLAFSARNVHLAQVNDSKQIAVSVYNIFTLGGLNLVLSFILDDPTSLLYLISTITFLCTVSTLLTLFVPRMLDIAYGRTNVIGGSTSSSKRRSVTPTTGAGTTTVAGTTFDNSNNQSK